MKLRTDFYCSGWEMNTRKKCEFSQKTMEHRIDAVVEECKTKTMKTVITQMYVQTHNTNMARVTECQYSQVTDCMEM